LFHSSGGESGREDMMRGVTYVNIRRNDAVLLGFKKNQRCSKSEERVLSQSAASGREKRSARKETTMATWPERAGERCRFPRGGREKHQSGEGEERLTTCKKSYASVTNGTNSPRRGKKKMEQTTKKKDRMQGDVAFSKKR